jgi:hypothetical protein
MAGVIRGVIRISMSLRLWKRNVVVSTPSFTLKMLSTVETVSCSDLVHVCFLAGLKNGTF